MIRHLLPFCVFLALAACKSSSTENDWQTLKLLGKVKSLRETSYKAVEKFGEITKAERLRAADASDYTLTFDEKGRQSACHYYNQEGKQSAYQTFAYDEKGRLIEQSFFGEGTQLLQKKVLKYTDKGLLAEATLYDAEGKILEKHSYEYDTPKSKNMLSFYKADGTLLSKEIEKLNTQGQPIEKAAYRADGSTSQKELYNEQRLLVEKIIYNTNGEVEEKYSFEYNEQGQLIATIIQKSKDSSPVKHTFEYDERGLLSMEKELREDGTVASQRSYLYQYDTQQNWIQRIEFYDEKPMYLLERSIEYYP